MSSTKRMLTGVMIFACLKFATTWQVPMDKPKTVFVPFSLDELENIQWIENNPNHIETTCGQFRAYLNEKPGKVAGRWYVVLMSAIPTHTNYCSLFTNIQMPCVCQGIDFTTNLKYGFVSFVMFSTNLLEYSGTYEMMTARTYGKNYLNFKQIVLQSFVLNSKARISGKGGYMVPNGIVIDSDNYNSYITLLFCLEGAKKPIIMVVVNALPMLQHTKDAALAFLKENDLETTLFEVNHENCLYAQNIVGLHN